jgi:hypothetical protein
MAPVAVVAAVVALLAVFGRSLLEGVSPLNFGFADSGPYRGAVRNRAGTASGAIIGAGPASGALSDLETARAREQRRQCRSWGD